MVRIAGDPSGAINAFNQVQRAASGLGRVLGRSVAAVGQTLAGGFRVAATAAAALGAATISAGASFNILSQRVSQSLTSMLGSGQAARQLREEVIELNRTAAFGRENWLQATQTLVAFGVEADQVSQVLRRMEDTIVAAGGTAAEFERLSQILGEIEASGRLTGKELNELVNLGIPALKLLAEQLGVSAQEVRDLASAGQIGFEDFFEAMRANEGAVQSFQETWQGASGLVTAAIRNIGSALVEAFIGLETGGAAAEAANRIAEALTHIEQNVLPGILPFVDSIADGFVAAAEAVATLAESIPQDALSQLAETFSGLGPLIAALGAGLGTAFARTLPIIGQFLVGINPIVVAIGALIVASEDLRNAFSDAFTTIIDAFAPVLPILTDLAGALLGALVPVLGSLAQALAGVLAALAPILQGLIESLTPVITILGEVLTSIIEQLGLALVDILNILAPHITTLVEAFGQLLAATLPLIPALLPLALIGVRLAAVFITLAAGPLIRLVELFAQLANTILPPLTSFLNEMGEAITEVVGRGVELLTENSDGLVSVLGLLVTVFESLVPLVSELWNDVIMPLAQSLREQLAPAFAQVWEQLQALWVQLQPVVEQLRLAWAQVSEQLTPALRQLFGVLAASLIPVLVVLARVVGATLVGSLRALVAILTVTIGTLRALGSVISFVIGWVNRLLGAIRRLGVVRGIIAGVANAFRALRGALFGIVGAINAIANAISRIRFPNIPAIWRRLIESAGSVLPFVNAAGPQLLGAGPRMAMLAPRALPVAVGAPPITLHVYLDGREVGGYVRTQVMAGLQAEGRRLASGAWR